MDGCMDVCMDGWTDGWTGRWMWNEMDSDQWMDGWMDVKWDGWIDWQTDGQMDGLMMDGRTDGWMIGWIDVKRDGWMSGWETVEFHIWISTTCSSGSILRGWCGGRVGGGGGLRLTSASTLIIAKHRPINELRWIALKKCNGGSICFLNGPIDSPAVRRRLPRVSCFAL